jgi:hypothetical protein
LLVGGWVSLAALRVTAAASNTRSVLLHAPPPNTHTSQRAVFFHRTMNKMSPDEDPWPAEVVTGPLPDRCARRGTGGLLSGCPGAAAHQSACCRLTPSHQYPTQLPALLSGARQPGPHQGRVVGARLPRRGLHTAAGHPGAPA